MTRSWPAQTDEGGALEVRQAFCRVEQQIPLFRNSAEHANGVAPDVAPLQHRSDPAGGDGAPPQGQPPEGHGKAPERPQAHRLHEQPEDRGRGLAAQDERLAGRPRGATRRPATRRATRNTTAWWNRASPTTPRTASSSSTRPR